MRAIIPTYLRKFNKIAIEVWARRSNYIPKLMGVITFLCPYLRYAMLINYYCDFLGMRKASFEGNHSKFLGKIPVIRRITLVIYNVC